MEKPIITQEEFSKIYEKHQLWLEDPEKGERADFSGKDLSKVNFSLFRNLRAANLSGVELIRANLTGVDLEGADLTEAELTCANLNKANLGRAKMRRANLGGANLTGANLGRTTLKGADLSGTNTLKSVISAIAITDDNTKFDSEQVNNSESSKLEQLKKEKIQLQFELAKEKVYNQKKALTVEEELKAKEAQIVIRELRIKELEDSLREKGNKIQEGLKESFLSLEKANDSINEEVKRLKFLYSIFMGGAFFFIIALFLIWFFAFKRYYFAEDIKYSNLLIYYSPSLISVGLLWGCIIELNKLQRHLIGLRKMTRKFSVIKIALEGYYNVTDELEREPDKAQQAFEEIWRSAIDEEIDFEKEEDKLKKSDARDRFAYEKTLDEIIRLISSLK